MTAISNSISPTGGNHFRASMLGIQRLIIPIWTCHRKTHVSEATVEGLNNLPGKKTEWMTHSCKFSFLSAGNVLKWHLAGSLKLRYERGKGAVTCATSCESTVNFCKLYRILLSSFKHTRHTISKWMPAVNSAWLWRGWTLNTNLPADWSQSCCCCSHSSPSAIPLRSCWRRRLHHQFSPPQSNPQVQGQEEEEDSPRRRPLWVCRQSCRGAAAAAELQTQRWDQQQIYQPQLWRSTKKQTAMLYSEVFQNISFAFKEKQDIL